MSEPACACARSDTVGGSVHIVGLQPAFLLPHQLWSSEDEMHQCCADTMVWEEAGGGVL